MKSIFISASCQPANDGVLNYNEEREMHILKDLVVGQLKKYKTKIRVYSNKKGDTMPESVRSSNNLNVDAHLALHSNANDDEKADGTEVFYFHQAPKTSNSYRLASAINKQVSPISPGSDKGILPDNYYFKQIWEIQKTSASAALVECFYHTNKKETAHWYKNKETYADAISQGILNYFQIKKNNDSVISGINVAFDKKIITSKAYWGDIVDGKFVATKEDIALIFERISKLC